MRHMHHNERVKLLQAVWLFERCTPKELAALARLATPVLIDEGACWPRRAPPARSSWSWSTAPRPRRALAKRSGKIGPGSFFGELALLDGGPRTATVRAETPMLVLVLDRSEFDALVEKSIPSVARRMLVTLAERLRAERLRAERLRTENGRANQRAWVTGRATGSLHCERRRSPGPTPRCEAECARASPVATEAEVRPRIAAFRSRLLVGATSSSSLGGGGRTLVADAV